MTPGAPVGVVGLGRMGSGIAKSLSRAGIEVLGHDLDPAARESMVTEGLIEVVGGIAELARRCPMIITVLPDGPDVESVAGELAASSAPGSLVVDCSTIDPDVSRTIWERLDRESIHFADAGMGGGAEDAETGNLLFMVGCGTEVWPLIDGLLSPIARKVVYCGEPGRGVAMKAIVNLLWLANFVADVEAVGLARAAGIEPAVAMSILSETGADNRALSMVGQLFGEVRGGFPVSLAAKDVRIAMGVAASLGLELEALAPAGAMLASAMGAGLGDQGVAAAGRVVEDRIQAQLSRARPPR